MTGGFCSTLCNGLLVVALIMTDSSEKNNRIYIISLVLKFIVHVLLKGAVRKIKAKCLSKN